MRTGLQPASRLAEACRRNALTAALGAAIASAVFALATLMRGSAAGAGFINLGIFIVVPSVCVIAYAAALMEESVLIRGARAFVLLLGLYFCLTLPAAPSLEAQHWKLPARVAQVLAALFGGALIPAIFLRLAGWRLRRAQRRDNGGQPPTEIRDQFGLFDLFLFITALSTLLALATATQRCYDVRLSEFLPSELYADVVLAMLIAALFTGSAGLAIFCVWFAEYGPRRVWLILFWFGAWMSLFALSCVAGSTLEHDRRPADFLVALALWVGVLFVPLTAASFVVQRRGWQLARRFGASTPRTE